MERPEGMAMWECRKCGESNPDWSPLCKRCREKYLAGTSGENRLATQTPDALAKRISENVTSRHLSDMRLSPLWALLPLMLVAATLGVYVILILTNIMDTNNGDDLFEHFYIWGRNVITIVFGALLGLLVYNMLRRMNMHFEREEELRAGIMAFLRAYATPRGREGEIISDLLKLSAFDGQASTYEKKLNPAWWGFGVALVFVLGALIQVIIYGFFFLADHYFEHSDAWIAFMLLASLAATVIAIAGIVFLFYLASHLMRTIYTHELRWQGFTNSSSIVLGRLGIEMAPVHQPHRLKERSVPLYAILTIVTAGIFGIYWLYTLIEDPNRHFRAQHDFEDRLLEATATMTSQPT